MTPAMPASGLRISWARTGRHFAQGRQMLGAGQLGAMQALDLLAALAQLPNHLIEMAAKIADIVVAVGKLNPHKQVAGPHLAIFCCNSSMGRWITTASTMKSTAQMTTAPAMPTASTWLRAGLSRVSVTRANRSRPLTRTTATGNKVLICQFSRTRLTKVS